MHSFILLYQKILCFIMKIQNKRELQQIASNHSSDIDFKDFMNLYKKYTTKPYCFLVIDTTLASDNDDKIRDEKLQNDINKETTKILALSSVKIEKYEYLTIEEILPSSQDRILEPAKFTYIIFRNLKQ